MKGRDLRTGEDFDDTGQIFINAGGFLNNWRWPQVDGMDSFKGPLLHSAHWDSNVQLKGKNVGLIGNGWALHFAEEAPAECVPVLLQSRFCQPYSLWSKTLPPSSDLRHG